MRMSTVVLNTADAPATATAQDNTLGLHLDTGHPSSPIRLGRDTKHGRDDCLLYP